MSDRAGLTRVEVLLCIVTILMLVALLSSVVHRAQTKTKGRVCTVRLHELALGISYYAQDHKSRLPWELSTSSGGTAEYALEALKLPSHYEVSPHYEAMSDYLIPW